MTNIYTNATKDLMHVGFFAEISCGSSFYNIEMSLLIKDIIFSIFEQ